MSTNNGPLGDFKELRIFEHDGMTKHMQAVQKSWNKQKQPLFSFKPGLHLTFPKGFVVPRRTDFLAT